MTTTTTHPYFTRKAADELRRAGSTGSPDSLAAWAETAKHRDDVDAVFIDIDGRPIAEAQRRGDEVRALYVSRILIDADPTRIVNHAADMSIGELQRATGLPVCILSKSSLTRGAGAR